MNVLADIVTVESFVKFVAGGAAVNVYGAVKAPQSKSLLEACKKDLEDVAWRIKQLTPRQREEIFALTRQGKCESLEKIERTYLRYAFTPSAFAV